MNKVFLIGNLTRDPELSETQSGVAVCRFGIAVNRRSGTSDGERKADFYNVTAWRGLGETVARYAKKGNKVAVIGNIELRTCAGCRIPYAERLCRRRCRLFFRTRGNAPYGEEEAFSSVV